MFGASFFSFPVQLTFVQRYLTIPAVNYHCAFFADLQFTLPSFLRSPRFGKHTNVEETPRYDPLREHNIASVI